MSTKIKKTIVAIPKTPKVVYSLSSTENASVKIPRRIPINNIVKLKLTAHDVQRLEARLRREKMGLLCDIGNKITEPIAFNAHEPHEAIGAVENTSKNPFKSLVKKAEVDVKTKKPEISIAEKRDLIINSGTKRKCHQIMDVYNGQTWPISSPYVCWYDCHPFDTTPVGIPQLLIGNTFYCHGNFCSYNCALRYLCPIDEDDFAQCHTNSDLFSGDDLSDKVQLLELLCRIETNLGFDEVLQKSPKRLCLKLFGGTMSIEEFRAALSTHSVYYITRSPMVPISYQMEESTDRTDSKKKLKGVSLNMAKLEKAYNDFLDKHCKDETLLQKLYRKK